MLAYLRPGMGVCTPLKMALLSCCLLLLGSTPGLAQEDAPAAASAQFDSGNTAWILVATALVLFMTIPALALFYGGLVRTKNVLSVLMHCFVMAALVSVVWVAVGYSLALGTEGNAFIGSFGMAFLSGVQPGAIRADTTIPEHLFCAFQMTFAIITPALVIGAFVERMKFAAVLWFSALWLLVVYVPICHMTWGGGWFASQNVIDFAGGIVVHITAGIAALVACIMVGKRRGYPEAMMIPHNLTYTIIGSAMLWVGWFGFNAGSALAADGSASLALLVTHLSACVATLTWMCIEWRVNGKPSVLGAATGAIAGLAAITPASGNVGPAGAFAIGVTSGLICFFASTTLKRRCGYDDSLDVVGVHGVGGLIGVLLVAFFASPQLGGTGYAEGMTMFSQLQAQLVAAIVTVVYTLIASAAIFWLIEKTVGLRVSAEQEDRGLDLTEHAESGYTF